MNNKYRFKLPEVSPPPWRDFEHHKNRKQRATTYQAESHEIEMVNAALLLRRPLLITGKPGVGKSSLAHAVAYELGLDEVLIWSITSKSTLQQGLYSYDALARLQDVSLLKSRKELEKLSEADKLQSSKENSKAEDIFNIGRYIRLGALGTAFLKSTPEKPCVVLIDEIDKSDIDLPNDLLHLFEEGEFEIPEIARLNAPENEKFAVYAHKSKTTLEADYDGLVRCQSFPLVIMTSNGEREFPPAFLRRCLRLTIKQPDELTLPKIVAQHLGLEPSQSNSATQLIKEFLDIQKNKEIATDQLLNAVYLATNTTMDIANHRNLYDAILKALSDN